MILTPFTLALSRLLSIFLTQIQSKHTQKRVAHVHARMLTDITNFIKKSITMAMSHRGVNNQIQLHHLMVSVLKFKQHTR